MSAGLRALCLGALCFAALRVAPTSARAQPEASAAGVRELQGALERGELEKAEAGAERILSGVRPVGRADSLLILDATSVLIEARLRRDPYDPTLPDLVPDFLSLCETLLDSTAAEIALAHQYAAILARTRRDPEGALAHSRAALEAIVRRVGPDHPETAKALSTLATVHFARGEPTRARELLEQSLSIQERKLAPGSVEIASTLINLNEARTAAGETLGVAAGYARAAEIFETREGPRSAGAADALHRAGAWRLRRGEAAAAAALLDRAVRIRALLDPRGEDLASSLLARAQAHLALAETDSAAACGERARRIFEEGGASAGPRRAGSWILLGDVAKSASRFAEAEERYRRALEILQGPPVRDPRELSSCLRSLAALALLQSRPDEALAHARRALEISEGDPRSDPQARASARLAYAAALRAAQQPDSAAAEVERAIAGLDRAGGATGAALSAALLDRAALARERGDLGRARTDAERALALLERASGEGSPSLAAALHELGIVQRRLGDEAGAAASLDRALALAAAERRDRPEVAAILSSRATLARARGDLASAEADFREALGILERALPAEHPQFAQVLRNLASLENAAGRFAEAEEHYTRALLILERALPMHPDVAATHLGLGNARKAAGREDLARGHYRRAIAIHREALGPEAAALALDYYNLAVLLLESGDLRAAMDTAAVAEILSQRHFRLVARGVSEREALRYSAGRVRGTDIVLTGAARSDSPGDWRRAWDLVIRSRAVVLEEIADRRSFLASAHDPEVARLDSILSAASNRLAHLAVRGRGRLGREAFRDLLDAARREKEAAERALADRSAPFRSRQAREEVGLAEVGAALPARSALVAWVRFDRLERPVAAASAGAAGAEAAAESTAATYAAFVLGDPARPPRFVVLGSAADIEARIAGWHREAGGGPRTRGSQAALDAYLRAGDALRRAVWDPVAGDLRDLERIFVVPDGALALVNFDALPTEGGRFVIEDYPLLQVLSSERDLLASPTAQAHGEGLLTAAAPDYHRLAADAAAAKGAAPAGTRGGGAPETSSATLSGSATRGLPCGEFKALWFDSLPGTRVEEREVARLWRKYGARVDAPRAGEKRPQIRELLGAEATERAFKRLAPGSNILHIATHGFFLGADCAGRRASAGAAAPDELTWSGIVAESPLLLSGLALAGANERRDASGPDDDGILTAEEIAALDLTGVDCVVLSACQTGLGKVEAGEGVFGLRRAFRVAGAHSLVMTLWTVDDVATTQWMERMFEHRLRHERTVAEAVRLASLDLLRRRRDERQGAHPYYWGAFVSTGEWR